MSALVGLVITCVVVAVGTLLITVIRAERDWRSLEARAEHNRKEALALKARARALSAHPSANGYRDGYIPPGSP